MPLNHTSNFQSPSKFCPRSVFFPDFFPTFSWLFPDFFPLFLDFSPEFFPTFFPTFFPDFFLHFFLDFFPTFSWLFSRPFSRLFSLYFPDFFSDSLSTFLRLFVEGCWPQSCYCCGLREHCGLISLLKRDIFSSEGSKNGQRFCRASYSDICFESVNMWWCSTCPLKTKNSPISIYFYKIQP